MKLKIIAGVLLFAGALLAVIGWVFGAFEPASSPTPARVVIAKPSAPVIQAAPAALALPPAEPEEVPRPEADPLVVKRVVQGVKRTVVVDGFDTPEDSPEVLLRRVQGSDRQACEDALRSFEQENDRSVVPQLEQIAAQTTDSQQKADIQEAIDFLKLPTIRELSTGTSAQ